MFCPEEYFTPCMLSAAFLPSLRRQAIHRVIFDANGLDAKVINSAHLEEVLSVCAQVFLHWYVAENANGLRLCQSGTNKVVRIDPWAVQGSKALPTALPTTIKEAEKERALIQSRLPFIDQELWVLDFERLHNSNSANASIVRLEQLFRDFDGWSLCFEQRSWPIDVGASMKSFAIEMASQRAVPKITPAKIGRPKKVEDVVAFLDEAYPYGAKLPSDKDLQRQLAKDINLHVGETTIANAKRRRRRNR